MVFSRYPALLAAGLLALAFSHQAAAVRVKGEPSKATAKSVTALEWRSKNFPSTSVAKLSLNELAPERIAKLHNYNADDSKIKPLQIGIARDVARETARPMSSLKWQVLANGAKVSRFEVKSPDAFALRVGIRTSGLVAGSELRFSGSNNPGVVTAIATGPQTKKLVDGKNLYWTPMTEGEAQYVEIYLPKDAKAVNVRLDVVSTSHLLTNAKENFVIDKASGSCNVNVICSVASLGQNFVDAKNAVARITFVDGGSTYLCSGTLLTDTVAASQLPYFYTADHCIGNQTLASTINTFWNYETTTCNGSTLTPFTQQTGGAVYLYSDPDTSATQTANGTDTSLVRLNDTPPAGTFFAGWDSSALANGAITGIHHPQGDPKKVSQGMKKSQSTKLQTVGWSSGTTEGGSSGSGLFKIGGDGVYYLRGGLYRGSASCANDGDPNTPANSDDYSRLDVSYPSIQQWLNPTPVNGPTVNHTGPWYNPAESGWGLTWYDNYPNGNAWFGLMFIYDGTGQADWYEFAGDWTGTDVHSGVLRQNTGPAFGTTFDPNQVVKTPVGTYTLTFTSATTATLTFTANGVTRTNVPLNHL